jgi:hypothetical protein
MFSTPLRLILHLASPPTDRLLLSPSAEACKQAFMGQLKEADFMRWGNTKRVTGLRKAEQDGMWEGVKDREFHPSFSPPSSFAFPWQKCRKFLDQINRPFKQIISMTTGALHPR